MTLYLFAGPNGSGKSTIIAQYIKENNLKNVEYICPDIYAQSIFCNIKDEKERYISAIKFSEYKRTKLLNENKPLIVETVLSRIDKIDFVKLAKEKGYKVISGITVIYTIDKLSPFSAALIHGVVLYLDYILLYLFNGWLQSSLKPIMIFTICFVLGYLIIWAIVFVVTRKCTKKLNESLN